MVTQPMMTMKPRQSFWAKLVKFLGPKALLTWLVLLMAFGSILSGLTEVVKGLEYGYAFSLMLTAITGGWLVALLPLREWAGWLWGTFLGVEIIFLRVGHLGDIFGNIVAAILDLLWQIGTWVWLVGRALIVALITREPGGIGPAFSSGRDIYWLALPRVYAELWSDLGTLFNRAARWLLALVQGNGTYDPIATMLLWGLGIWLCAWWAGWAVSRRHRPLAAMLPGGLLGAFILAYAWASTFSLLMMLGFTLLLMALERQRAREKRWHRTGTDFSRDLWVDLVGIATLVSIGLIVAAAISPSITIERFQDIAEWINEITQPEEAEPVVAESLGIEQQPPRQPVSPVERARTTTLPRKHLIGSPPELSRMIVMVVRTDELPKLPEILLIEDEVTVPRHYWRSITYDHYYSQGWATSGTALSHYAAGELANTPEVDFHKIVRQEVQVVGIQDGTVHVDGTLVSLDQPFDVHWRPPLEIFAVTSEAKKYRADSITTDITAEDLRNVGTEIPAWISDRYLNLPDSLPQRVRDLAFELTATEPTAYDRARVIELYLREFPYTLDVPMPPYTGDIADYFLFELQEGYCDYYATTMVVLARAAGLPARLVIGYADGTYNAEEARYIITEADAHAWPEIYFPDVGWVEFEPTPSLPEINRALFNDEREIDYAAFPLFDRLPPLPEAEDSLALGEMLLWAVGSGLGALLILTGVDSLFLLVWGDSQAMVTHLYHRLQQYQRSLRASTRTGHTPFEVAGVLTQRLNEISQGRAVAEEVLPPAADEVAQVVNAYVQAWYSSHPLTRKERWSLVGTWWLLRWRLWLARMLRNPKQARLPMPVRQVLDGR